MDSRQLALEHMEERNGPHTQVGWIGQVSSKMCGIWGTKAERSRSRHCYGMNGRLKGLHGSFSSGHCIS